VIEEALLAISAKKPLYLATFLGGAAEQVSEALEGKPMANDFCPTPLADLYRSPQFQELNGASALDCTVDRLGVWQEFARVGTAQLSVNGLSEGENHELLHTPVIDQVIELVLVGLSRLCKDRN
jgi:hypothetical protein